MTFGIQVLDYIVLQLMWICHNIYYSIASIGKRQTEAKTEANNTTVATDVQNRKKHFIHLYTTTSVKNGRPVCYMDVYEILSPSDEQRLRQASSRGIPNKTYYKYHQDEVAKQNHLSPSWFGYSTLAI